MLDVQLRVALSSVSFLFVKPTNHVLFFSLFPNRMKPRKVKEDDAPRTIACPHKVSVMTLPRGTVSLLGFLIGLIVCVTEN